MPSFLPPEIIVGEVSHGRIPERMLMFGSEGSGKTHNWLTIADMCANIGSDQQFYVADTDFAVPRSMSNRFSHLTNVNVTDVTDFKQYVLWAQSLKETVTPGDFVIADMGGHAYHFAQEHYFESKYGMSRSEVEWERLFDRADDDRGPLVEPEDWINIRNGFNNLWNRMIIRDIVVARGASLFATAETKDILKHFDGQAKDKTVWLTYKDLGFKPDAHKTLLHKSQTVAMCRRLNNGFWLNPVKDRERPGKTVDELLTHLKVEDFAIDFLMGRAGWEIVE